MKGEPKRRALGKGLGSLIPDAPAGNPLDVGQTGTGRPRQVAVTEIRANPDQPRRVFDEEEIASLADSIRVSGVLQPLLVRREPGGGYTLVAGERRLRAAKKAGLETVPVVLREVADDRMLELALVENLQRDDLGPMETARAFRQLVRRFKLTQSEVASRIALPRSSVANFLRLLELPERVQELLEEGRLTMGHGRALAGLDDARTKVRLAEAAARGGWSVRRMEREVRRRVEASSENGADSPVRRRDPNVVAAEETLSRSLAARVRIDQASSGRGRIEIRFADGEDLDRLYRALIRVGGAGAH